MSVFLGVLDGRDFVYVRAGQCPPLLLHGESGEISELDAPCQALGPDPHRPVEVAVPVRLEAGDILLLHTDGVVEARDQELRMFGEDRLPGTLRDLRDLTSRGIVEGILERVGPGHEDDLTLVAVKAL